MKKFYMLLGVLCLLTTAKAQTYHQLSSGPLLQNWSDISLITTNDDWSGVASIRGFLGQNLTPSTGTDPQTILSPASSSSGDLDIIANQTSTNINNGGVAEFHIANPVVAMQGSGTADAPFLVFYLNSLNRNNVRVQFTVSAVNSRSRAAVLKLGATEEGRLRDHRVNWQGEVRDTLIFSILAGEWPEVERALAARLRPLA